MTPAPGAQSLIDRVDEADRPIGAIARERVFQERANFRTVHVFVFNDRGDLLLQQLGRSRERNPLTWGSSVAAYLHQGETEVDAAARRIREELGLRTKLRKHGSTWMMDQGCRKFITLFVTKASHPEIRERKHIESIRFMQLDDIVRDLKARPGHFTETFHHVFRFYRATVELARANA